MIFDIIKLAATGCIVLLVELVLNPLWEIKGASPDLVLIFIVILAVKTDRIRALLFGFIFGLLQDSLTTNLFGLFAFCKSTIGFFLAWRVESQDITLKTWMWFPLIFAAGFFQFVIYGVVILQGSEISFVNYLIDYIIPQTIYTAIIGSIWGIMPTASIKLSHFRSKKSDLGV